MDVKGQNNHADTKALLLTRYDSFESFKQAVQITYEGDTNAGIFGHKARVNLKSGSILSTLKMGVSEHDFQKARKGNIWEKLSLVFVSPYTLLNKTDLERVEILSRRRDHMFGEGDVAFYDIAETMVHRIVPEDTLRMTPKALSEKGYLNTFNHVVAQTFMTTIFSESLADFVGDVHERSRLPELITGNFSMEQIQDVDNGPVDNYLDMINNECGQELGKMLRSKYNISRTTNWTPDLLTDYLNDIVSYHSWVFHIGFVPFRPEDELVIRFAAKVNAVMTEVDKLKRM